MNAADTLHIGDRYQVIGNNPGEDLYEIVKVDGNHVEVRAASRPHERPTTWNVSEFLGMFEPHVPATGSEVSK